MTVQLASQIHVQTWLLDRLGFGAEKRNFDEFHLLIQELNPGQLQTLHVSVAEMSTPQMRKPYTNHK